MIPTIQTGESHDRQQSLPVGHQISFATLMAVSTGTVLAQTRFKQGFNRFSVEQDLEIGRQSSIEAKRQLPILENRSIEDYVNEIGERLAAVAAGANFPYQFKIVNPSDINFLNSTNPFGQRLRRDHKRRNDASRLT